MIGHASISENGTVNGNAGDSTGKEVCIRSWYNKPWDMVLRAINPLHREFIAYHMEQACNNNNIGYSQNSRNSILEEFNKAGNFTNITNKCNCDCSSLVAVICLASCCKLEDVSENGNLLTTFNMEKKLMATGLFEKITNNDFLTSDTYLIRGDILLNTKHHVAVNLDNGMQLTKPKENNGYNINTYILQRSIKNDGFYSYPKYGVDGEFGNETRESLNNVIIRKNPNIQLNTVAFVQDAIGAKVDGYFGDETSDKLVTYQRKNNLMVDGVIGKEVLTCILRSKGVNC